MAQPFGYPDYNRTFAAARKLLWLELNTVIAAATNRGPFVVGNLQTLGLRFFANANHARVTLTWYADAGLTVFVTQDIIELRQGDGFDQHVPVAAAFLQVTVTNFGGNLTFSMLIYEGTGTVAHQFTAGANILVEFVSVAVGAGATTRFDSIYVWPGEAHWYVSSAVATWAASVRSQEAGGAVHVLDSFGQARSAENRRVFLPAMHPYLEVTNTSGAGGNFSGALVARPFVLGG